MITIVEIVRFIAGVFPRLRSFDINIDVKDIGELVGLTIRELKDINSNT